MPTTSDLRREYFKNYKNTHLRTNILSECKKLFLIKGLIFHIATPSSPPTTSKFDIGRLDFLVIRFTKSGKMLVENSIVLQY